jgi:hypothetical protein
MCGLVQPQYGSNSHTAGTAPQRLEVQSHVLVLQAYWRGIMARKRWREDKLAAVEYCKAEAVAEQEAHQHMEQGLRSRLLVQQALGMVPGQAQLLQGGQQKPAWRLAAVWG